MTQLVSLPLAAAQPLVLLELAPERVRPDAEHARRLLAVAAHLLQHEDAGDSEQGPQW